MHSDQLTVLEDLHDPRRDTSPYLAADQRVVHRVEAFIHLDVVVRMHKGIAPIGVLVASRGQSPGGGSVIELEELITSTLALLEALGVHLIDDLADRCVKIR